MYTKRPFSCERGVRKSRHVLLTFRHLGVHGELVSCRGVGAVISFCMVNASHVVGSAPPSLRRSAISVCMANSSHVVGSALPPPSRSAILVCRRPRCYANPFRESDNSTRTTPVREKYTKTHAPQFALEQLHSFCVLSQHLKCCLWRERDEAYVL
jgi:hypothetical protein